MLPQRRARGLSLFPAFWEDWPFDELRRHANGGSLDQGASQARFGADLIEYEDRFELSVDLPGVSRDELEISFEDNKLYLTVQRDTTEENDTAKYHHRSRWWGKSTSCFAFPEIASGDEIDASLHDGVLTVVAPKQADKKPKRIEIRAKQ